MSKMTIQEVMERTDWKLLAEQKQEVVDQIERLEGDVVLLRGPLNCLSDADDREQEAGRLTGLLHFIDAIQDAAAAEGFPVYDLEEK